MPPARIGSPVSSFSPAVQPADDGLGDAVGEATSGLCSPRWSSGVVQSSGSGFAAGSIIGQMVTRPESRVRAALWTGAMPASDSAACTVPRPKTASTAASTFGTERKERWSCGSRPFQAGGAGAPAELAPHAREPGRHRALEGEDRLLLVADGEQRACRLGGAVAGEELLGQCLDHLPLARAGVLRLVDQDVVEAAVELVVDPARRRRRAARSARRLDDEVLEVEDAARDLGAVIVVDGGVGEPEHGRGRSRSTRRAARRSRSARSRSISPSRISARPGH